MYACTENKFSAVDGWFLLKNDTRNKAMNYKQVRSKTNKADWLREHLLPPLKTKQIDKHNIYLTVIDE